MRELDFGDAQVRAGVDARGSFVQIGDALRIRVADWVEAYGLAIRLDGAVWPLKALEAARPPRLPVPVPGEPGTEGWT